MLSDERESRSTWPPGQSVSHGHELHLGVVGRHAVLIWDQVEPDLDFLEASRKHRSAIRVRVVLSGHAPASPSHTDQCEDERRMSDPLPPVDLLHGRA